MGKQFTVEYERCAESGTYRDYDFKSFSADNAQGLLVCVVDEPDRISEQVADLPREVDLYPFVFGQVGSGVYYSAFNITGEPHRDLTKFLVKQADQFAD